jgi:hypothetical protein
VILTLQVEKGPSYFIASEHYVALLWFAFEKGWPATMRDRKQPSKERILAPYLEGINADEARQLRDILTAERSKISTELSDGLTALLAACDDAGFSVRKPI